MNPALSMYVLIPLPILNPNLTYSTYVHKLIPPTAIAVAMDTQLGYKYVHIALKGLKKDPKRSYNLPHS